MISCKNCHQTSTTKNGYVRGKQRYHCQSCQYNFVLGDARHKSSSEVKKALSVILYALSKSSFGFLGKLFGVSRTTAYYWIRDIAETMAEPVIAANIHAIEFDEMWHVLQSKKRKSGSSKPWIIAQGELSPGYSVVVMLQPSNGCMIK